MTFDKIANVVVATVVVIGLSIIYYFMIYNAVYPYK